MSYSGEISTDSSSTRVNVQRKIKEADYTALSLPFNVENSDVVCWLVFSFFIFIFLRPFCRFLSFHLLGWHESLGQGLG